MWMQKHPQTRKNIFWIFMDFHRIIAGPKSNSHHRTEISSMASLTMKLSLQAKIKNSEKKSLGELEQNYCDRTQHISRITGSWNLLVKIQGHEVAYITTHITYTTEWISIFRESVLRLELIHTTAWVCRFYDMD